MSNANNFGSGSTDFLTATNNQLYGTTMSGADEDSGNQAHITVQPQNVAEARQNVVNFYRELSSQAKFLLLFLILVALKLICYYLVMLVLMGSIWYSFYKVRKVVDVQLALKSRANIKTLGFMFAANIILLGSTIVFVDSLGYTEKFIYHLLLMSVNKQKTNNILEVVWNCLVMDLFIQLCAHQCRILICVVSTFLREPKVIRIIQKIRSYEVWKNNVFTSTTVGFAIHERSCSSKTDIEAGLKFPKTYEDGVHVRRVYVGDSTAAAEIALDEGQASDDSNTESNESWDYLMKLKICKSFDLCSYLYRNLLPVPLWMNFFDHSSSSLNVLTLIYLSMKLYDISWKFRGAIEAFDILIYGKLEFGHYSTPEEYDNACTSYDCPVCFESPRTPVTLDCKHIFCEVCIAEWLNKEKTCPVCRAEVLPVSPQMGIVKKDSSSGVPIIV